MREREDDRTSPIKNCLVLLSGKNPVKLLVEGSDVYLLDSKSEESSEDAPHSVNELKTDHIRNIWPLTIFPNVAGYSFRHSWVIITSND